MTAISFKRHRYPADVIRYAVWLYLRFTFSLRDVEEILAQKGVDVSYETIRCWTIKFGPQIAERLKKRRPPPSPRWHLDEMVCKIGGKRMYLRRAVDDEGEIVDLLMYEYRDGGTAVKFLMQMLTTQPVLPERIITDRFRSYGYAFEALDLSYLHTPVPPRKNNRAENSHLPIRRRERKMMGFRSKESAQRFLASHAAVYNNFNTQRHMTSRRALKVLRAAAFETWTQATCA